MTPRFHTSARPADGHLPADWATTSKRGTIRLGLLAAATLFAAALLLHAISPAEPRPTQEAPR